MLRGAGVRLLVDVRAHPGSRRHPHGEFAAGAGRLVESGRGTRLAMMCAEQHPSGCHRRLISDWLASREIEVEHLIDMRRSEPHVLTKGAVIAAGLLTYPGGVQPDLDIG